MKRVIGLILTVVLLCAGCTSGGQKTVFAMDTVMDLQLYGKDGEKAVQQVESMLYQLEKQWSAHDEESLLAKLNRGEEVTLSAEEQALLEQVEALSQRTGGVFDPKMYMVSRLWGFTDDDHRIPTENELQAALADSQWDLGGALKGYAGRQAVELLKNLSVSYGILNLGGNVQTYGEKPDGTPWNIGLQNPNGGDPVGVLPVLGTAAVVTSGDYQRYFELDGVRYHHILDPETGMPARSGLSSVTVICADGLTADVLSTALFVMGLEDATDFWRQSEDFEAVFITEGGKIYATQGVALSGCEYEVIDREN